MWPRILLCRFQVLTSVCVLLITSTLTCTGSTHQTCSAGFEVREAHMVVYVSTLCYCSYRLLSKLQDSKLKLYLISMVGRASSVGIATRYTLDGSGIKSLWGLDFPHPSQTGRGAHPASCTVGTRGLKRLGRGVDYPPSSSAEVTGRVQL
jgi:hypothetical protein